MARWPELLRAPIRPDMTDPPALPHPAAPDRMLRLPDGRHLCYVRWNPAGHHPILFFHGTPGTRHFRPADLSVLGETDADLVTVDRPGYGRSTRQKERTLLGWADDVARLADALGWDRFAVCGVSGGGPHALACGCRLADRVTVVGAISSVAPFWPGALDGMMPLVRWGFRLAPHAPGPATGAMRLALRCGTPFIRLFQRRLPPGDRQVLERPGVLPLSLQTIAAALSTPVLAEEIGLFRRPWGFELSEVRVPVELWHGEADNNVPIAHGRRIAAALPHCRATWIPGAGHYLIFDCWRPILARLAGYGR